MQILQEQKSALPPTPANRATEPACPILKIGKLFITESLAAFPNSSYYFLSGEYSVETFPEDFPESVCAMILATPRFLT